MSRPPVRTHQPPSPGVSASASAAASASGVALDRESGAASAGPSIEPRSPGRSPDTGGVASAQAHTSKAIATIADASARLIASFSIARPASFAAAALGILFAAAEGGCSSAPSTADAVTDGPGARVVSSIIACKDDGDCKSGEACGEGFCQMKRCTDLDYASTPPFGTYGYVFVDRAFVVANDSSTLPVLSAHTNGRGDLTAPESPLDIAGGNLTGSRPESVALITQTGGLQTLAPDGTSKQLGLGWPAKRLATGDVDGDGIDEVVAIGDGGLYAVCSAIKGSCDEKTSAASASDVAVGDVDGDGFGEILLADGHTLTVINANAAATGEPQTTTVTASPTLAHLTAGDLDGDGVAEIIASEVGSTFSDDRLYVFHINGGLLAKDAEFALGYTVDNGALDVAFARQDDKPLIGVLSDSSTFRIFSYANGALTKNEEVTVQGNARRLAAADVNGRSASVRLKAGPTVTAGPPVPIAVLTLPPYSTAHSAGPSSVSLGSGEDHGTSQSEDSSKGSSVSLSVGAGIGFKVFGAGVSAGGSISRAWSSSTSHSKSRGTGKSIGHSYSLSAQPQVDGYQSGGVVLAGGCFHRYDYEVEDPQHVSDAPTGEMSTFIPVGGETSLWSTARYNALSDAIGGGKLPKVTITSKLGDVSSYPSDPVTLDGKPIPKADNVFPTTGVTRTSDVGNASFSLSTSTSSSNSDAASFSYDKGISGSAGLSLSIVNVSGSAGANNNWSLGRSYGVSVGSSTSFSGSVPAVRDDPNTPADEAALYGYSFRPVVYREHFQSVDGQQGAFYVLTYAVGK